MIFTPWSLVEAAKKVWGRRRRRKDRENHWSMTIDRGHLKNVSKETDFIYRLGIVFGCSWIGDMSRLGISKNH